MAIIVSPYLSTPQTAPQTQPAVAGTAAPKNPGAASSTGTADSVNLSPAAQQALAGAPSPAEGQKTPLQTVLETILAAVQNSTGPTLNFGSATDSQTGKTLDKSC
jgi:hypothetical protein